MILQYPNFIVYMNGTALQGVESVTVTEPVAFKVGTFRFSKVFVPNDNFPAEWWCATSSKTMRVEIYLSTDTKSFTRRILGNVDSHSFDPIAGTISVAGRDLGALLVDSRVLKTHRNMTASEIATNLANAVGLTAQVTNTKTLTGRLYDTDHDQSSGDSHLVATNQWDLLCRLGSREGIIPYVQGETLYFQTVPQNPPLFTAEFSRDANGYPVSNVNGIKLTRYLTQARDVKVTVRSWHSRSKKTFSATFRTSTKIPGESPHQAPTIYIFNAANLTKAQCSQRAQKIALDISQHERNTSISIPYLSLLSPTYQLQIKGTGTDYDMTYAMQRISYHIDIRSGGQTSIDAKFSSPVNLYDDDTGEIVGEQA